MPIRKTWTEIVTNAGGTTFDFLDQVAEKVRDHVCDLWFTFPDKMAGNLGVIGAYPRGFMNQACQDKSLPPPPSVPFTGGQCCDLTYDVEVTFDLKRCFNNDTVHSGTQTRTVTGKVNGVVLQPCTSNPSLSCVEIEYENCDGDIFYEQVFSTTRDIADDACFTTSPIDPDADDIDPVASTYSIINITVVGGGTDNCGDPPIQYPPSPPANPGNVNTQIEVNLFDGNTTNLDLDLVTINNDFDLSLQLPIKFNIAGLIVDIDVGGINFNNNTSNDTFDPEGTRLPDGTRHPLPAPTNPSLPPPKPPAPNGENYDEEEKTETDPKQEEVGIELEFVRITITQVPGNVKNQWGDGAPDVVYVGWFEFQGEGYNFHRTPIHFEQAVYRAPEGATGYAYTLYEGVSGFATVYKTKELGGL